MRNVHNAVSDALMAIRANRGIQDKIELDANNPGRYIITLTHVNLQKNLVAEVLTVNGEFDSAGVLERVGFSQRFETNFMDALMMYLN